MKIKEKLKYMLSFFKRVHYIEINGREFYIKRRLFKKTISLKSIEYYDCSGKDNHIWKFIDCYWTSVEPDILWFEQWVYEQRPTDFDYKIKGYINDSKRINRKT